MKRSRSLVIVLAGLATLCTAGSPARAAERFGAVSFNVSCSSAVQAPFNRGVALLHDFWYDEARPQFEKIAKADPSCAMAHWGIAMSAFHQIWDRPDEATFAFGWREMQESQSLPAKTERERAYIAALSGFFQPGAQDYQARIERYSAAMAELYRRYPHDTDAGAFYALSLLAAVAPDDTSLTHERQAPGNVAGGHRVQSRFGGRIPRGGSTS